MFVCENLRESASREDLSVNQFLNTLNDDLSPLGQQDDKTGQHQAKGEDDPANDLGYDCLFLGLSCTIHFGLPPALQSTSRRSRCP
jgi:hypothetical protein